MNLAFSKLPIRPGYRYKAINPGQKVVFSTLKLKANLDVVSSKKIIDTTSYIMPGADPGGVTPF